jgi:hypothetical protein
MLHCCTEALLLEILIYFSKCESFFFYCSWSRKLLICVSDIWYWQIKNSLILRLIYIRYVFLACSPLDPRFAGSIPTEVDGFLSVIKIRSTTSFGGEVKSSVPCRRFTACKRTLRAWIEPVMSVSKIQAAISHPSLLTACQMALAVSSGSSKNLCGQWTGHSLQNAHLPTRKPSGWNPKKKEALAHPGL